MGFNRTLTIPQEEGVLLNLIFFVWMYGISYGLRHLENCRHPHPRRNTAQCPADRLLREPLMRSQVTGLTVHRRASFA